MHLIINGKKNYELRQRWKRNSASEARNRLQTSSYSTVRSESRCALTLRYADLVVSIEVPVKCAVVSLYSVVKQRLKYNTGKMYNCLTL
jgi:hypothetical protein